MQLDLVNRGMSKINVVAIQVSSESGVLSQSVYTVDLASGASETVFVAVSLSDTVPESLTIQTYAVGYTDQNIENNSASIALHLKDISLEESVLTATDDGYEITILAVNRGQVNLSNVAVSVTDDTGVELDNEIISSLSVGEGTFIKFAVRGEFESYETLKVSVADLGDENLLGNNSLTVVLPVKQTSEVSVTSDVIETENGIKVLTTILNSTDQEIAGTICFATYDSNKKMLDVSPLSQVTVDADDSFVSQAEFSCDNSEIYSIKVFILDGDWKPLLGVQNIVLQ